EWIKRACERYAARVVAPIGTVPPGTEQERSSYAIGIDVARFGGDNNVIAVLQNGRLIALECWASTDTVETEARILRFLRQIGYRQSDRVTVDEGAAGGGAGVLDHLIAAGIQADGFNGARRAYEDPDRYENLRAWAYWALRV